jgi:ribonuclease HI
MKKVLPDLQRNTIQVQPIVPMNSLGNEYILHFDGCCKGNPGPSGAGAVIYKDKEEIWSCSKFLGNITNNQSEYNALIIGLEKAVELSISQLCVFGDSQLAINQINKIYKVTSPQIKPLYEKVCVLQEMFQHIEFHHVYRHENKRADELANQAMILEEKEITPQFNIDTPIIVEPVSTLRKKQVCLKKKTTQLAFPNIFAKK